MLPAPPAAGAMRLHEDELALARAFNASSDFEGLTDDQVAKIVARGRALFHWFKAHPGTHTLINVGVLIFIFGVDYWAQVVWPEVVLTPGNRPATGAILLAAGVAGAIHSWLIYSLAIFALHEGAAHRLIFPPNGPVSRFFHRLSVNLARIGGAEPNSYAADHMSHHARFGTGDDAEFLNFVRPRRYWLTLLPLATYINYSDFVAHRPLAMTRDRLLSNLWAIPYHGAYVWYAWTHFGALFTVFAYLVVLPHIGFPVDRLRQFTEHNLMPLENRNGARSFGLGFWGLLVGGGPWGQPCHLEHHLVPSIPWYQQAILHRYVVSVLTPRQRRQFLLTPVVGFPRLWWRTIREPDRFAASREALKI
jgi:Fatty acid desaturase